MNQRHKPPPRRPKNPAYRQAFERLDEALEENTSFDNVDKRKLLRRALFGDVEKHVKTNPITLPQP
jgi:hypothetical protein